MSRPGAEYHQLRLGVDQGFYLVELEFGDGIHGPVCIQLTRTDDDTGGKAGFIDDEIASAAIEDLIFNPYHTAYKS